MSNKLLERLAADTMDFLRLRRRHALAFRLAVLRLDWRAGKMRGKDFLHEITSHRTGHAEDYGVR